MSCTFPGTVPQRHRNKALFVCRFLICMLGTSPLLFRLRNFLCLLSSSLRLRFATLFLVNACCRVNSAPTSLTCCQSAFFLSFAPASSDHFMMRSFNPSHITPFVSCKVIIYAMSLILSLLSAKKVLMAKIMISSSSFFHHCPMVGSVGVMCIPSVAVDSTSVLHMLRKLLVVMTLPFIPACLNSCSRLLAFISFSMLAFAVTRLLVIWYPTYRACSAVLMVSPASLHCCLMPVSLFAPGIEILHFGVLHFIPFPTHNFPDSSGSCCNVVGSSALIFTFLTNYVSSHLFSGILICRNLSASSSAYPSMNKLKRQGLARNPCRTPRVTKPVLSFLAPTVLIRTGCSATGIMCAVFVVNLRFATLSEMSLRIRS